MEKPHRGIIGPFPPIWRMKEANFKLDKEVPPEDKIEAYEKIITLFSDFHNDFDKEREKLAKKIEVIINQFEPPKPNSKE